MTSGRFKRFYKQATTDALPPDTDDGDDAMGFRVLLDGRTIKTPAKASMVLPTQALAEAIASEWQSQGDDVDIRSLLLTGLVWTAIDRVRANRTSVVDEVAAYAAHDLVCYRAEGPADLSAQQQAAWQPLLDWLTLSFDAPLLVTAGVVSVVQPLESLATLHRVAAAKDDFELTALSSATAAAGSLIIALALLHGRIDAAQAFTASQLDESYQIERWGEDPETARRRAAIRDDLDVAARFLALLRG